MKIYTFSPWASPDLWLSSSASSLYSDSDVSASELVRNGSSCICDGSRDAIVRDGPSSIILLMAYGSLESLEEICSGSCQVVLGWGPHPIAIWEVVCSHRQYFLPACAFTVSKVLTCDLILDLGWKYRYFSWNFHRNIEISEGPISKSKVYSFLPEYQHIPSKYQPIYRKYWYRFVTV